MCENGDSNFDLLVSLVESGLESVAQKILELLDVLDLKCCQLVSSQWNQLVERLYDHHEWIKVGRGWSQGNPKVQSLQCLRERAVCTVNAMALDERYLVCSLGSSGYIELWDRRQLHKEQLTQSKWRVLAHEEGAYSVDLNRHLVVSGGDDWKVKIWNKETGALIYTLYLHKFVVWSVKLWMDVLTTYSYDCTISVHRINFESQTEELTLEKIRHLTGPTDWANGLVCDKRGRFLVTQDELKFNLSIYNLIEENPEALVLSGHTDEVNCAKFLLPFLASGGEDKTVRLWKLDIVSDKIRGAQCVRILTGHEGKIWSLDMDRRRVVAGGRYGEVRIWSLNECLDQTKTDAQCSGRSLWTHPRSTAIGQVYMERALLVTCDGLGTINMLDFWNLETSVKKCGCSNFAIPDLNHNIEI